ncbi:hypothetical protein PENNAL_c0001G01878 [Penicillium nalgiovense]|uniref:Chalcone/stilbene synthase C-terminal domain-containing protein n=1 Tax=Penicillium nalgiovense TaxID=60175 RepID=A0A1V6ZA82_PENNA|nr:hypothetical protein PENNAL_c0001G01878 [Penicillium nalgiovense]
MNSDQANIAAALFADSEAAFVLCNEYAMAQDEQVTPQFELLEWGCDLVPGTAEHMTFYAGIDGIHDFDWALHPGGRAIIDAVAEDLQLSKDQLQASREIYRTSGNSSSASVLIVLVRLRLESKKAHIAATSFGPGLAIEMALLRMCQVDE